MGLGNPQENLILGNPQENLGLGNPQENLRLGNPQENLGLGNPQENLRLGNPQENLGLGNPQENLRLNIHGTEAEDTGTGSIEIGDMGTNIFVSSIHRIGETWKLGTRRCAVV